jgi:hypothetical protein
MALIESEKSYGCTGDISTPGPSLASSCRGIGYPFPILRLVNYSISN